VVGEAPATATTTTQPTPQRMQDVVPLADMQKPADVLQPQTNPANLTVETRSGNTVVLENSVDLSNIVVDLPETQLEFSEAAFWEATAQLPMVGGGGVYRLMLREFERFYNGQILPEKTPRGVPFERRVIEERLVFADIMVL
jgi:hypothetical protein